MDEVILRPSSVAASGLHRLSAETAVEQAKRLAPAIRARAEAAERTRSISVAISGLLAPPRLTEEALSDPRAGRLLRAATAPVRLRRVGDRCLRAMDRRLARVGLVAPGLAERNRAATAPETLTQATLRTTPTFCYRSSIDRSLGRRHAVACMAKHPDPLVRALASRVRQLRPDEGWTQKVLAHRAGLDPPT
jgi:hypothetical protein